MRLQRRLRLIEQRDASMDRALKIAFASSDRKTVDQHFGAARGLVIHAVWPDAHQLLEAAEFGDLRQDGGEDKLAIKFQVLEGCAAVYCQAAGASAVGQLLSLGVQPLKVAPGSPIDALIAALQAQMRDAPPAWLLRAMRRRAGADPGRFAALAAEGWRE